MRALVRTDPPGAVVLDADPGKETAPRPRLSVGSAVELLVGPQCRLTVAHDDAVIAPVGEPRGRRRVGVFAEREVDVNDVVGRFARELRALLGVEDVIRRRHEIAEPPRLREVVMQGSQRLDVCHDADRTLPVAHARQR